MIKVCLLIFVIWFLNLELNPQLGNIWYRTNHLGNRSFTIVNVLRFIKGPFLETIFWNWSMWDVNWITFYILWLSYYKSLSFFSSKDKVGSKPPSD